MAAALPARHARRGEDLGDEADSTRSRSRSSPCPPPTLRRLLDGGREILIPKKQYDPFTNPNTETLLDVLDPDEILLFGVATDICDDAAVRALLRRGRRITFVEDASRGVDESRVAACTAAWRDAGVRFTTAEEAAASLG